MSGPAVHAPQQVLGDEPVGAADLRADDPLNALGPGVGERLPPDAADLDGALGEVALPVRSAALHRGIPLGEFAELPIAVGIALVRGVVRVRHAARGADPGVLVEEVVPVLVRVLHVDLPVGLETLGDAGREARHELVARRVRHVEPGVGVEEVCQVDHHVDGHGAPAEVFGLGVVAIVHHQRRLFGVGHHPLAVGLLPVHEAQHRVGPGLFEEGRVEGQVCVVLFEGDAALVAGVVSLAEGAGVPLAAPARHQHADVADRVIGVDLWDVEVQALGRIQHEGVAPLRALEVTDQAAVLDAAFALVEHREASGRMVLVAREQEHARGLAGQKASQPTVVVGDELTVVVPRLATARDPAEGRLHEVDERKRARVVVRRREVGADLPRALTDVHAAQGRRRVRGLDGDGIAGRCTRARRAISATTGSTTDRERSESEEGDLHGGSHW